MASPRPARPTAFGEGISNALNELKEKVRRLYREDNFPWVIGYSGGKDSTAVAQLVWMSLAELPENERTKPVYVITTDTLVENPIVAAWVENSLQTMEAHAASECMPFKPHLIKPDVAETFWVNLIGKGYPAPRPKFRWCTERLKIKPSSRFIQDTANEYGEVVLLLGARRAESTVRAASLNRRTASVRSELNAHPDLPNTQVFTPIEDWSNDDVWTFLMRFPNPWGHSNKDLMSMYRGATEDNECPVVVDTSTPSCGNSRFGCWVCTLVDQDKSMTAMIQNDEEKEWMTPLLAFRNELDFRSSEARERDRARRDFRRLGGHMTHYFDAHGNVKLTPGPYTQGARKEWLTRLLCIQRDIRENPEAPAHVRNIELITLEELQEIRRIWVAEKGEIEDYVPVIYEDVMNEPYPGKPLDEHLTFDRESLDLLRDVCGENELHYEMIRNLLNVERQYVSKAVRHGLFDDLTSTVQRCFFADSKDALNWYKLEKGIDDRPTGVEEQEPEQLSLTS